MRSADYLNTLFDTVPRPQRPPTRLERARKLETIHNITLLEDAIINDEDLLEWACGSHTRQATLLELEAGHPCEACTELVRARQEAEKEHLAKQDKLATQQRRIIKPPAPPKASFRQFRYADAVAFARLHGYTYKGSKSPTRDSVETWECPNGHSRTISFRGLSKIIDREGKGCKVCHKAPDKRLLKSEKLASRLQELGVTVDEWKGAKKSNLFRCIDCEFKWPDFGITVLYQGQKCPRCYPRKGGWNRKVNQIPPLQPVTTS